VHLGMNIKTKDLAQMRRSRCNSFRFILLHAPHKRPRISRAGPSCARVSKPVLRRLSKPFLRQGKQAGNSHFGNGLSWRERRIPSLRFRVAQLQIDVK
jgi:hypothetical protein